MGKKILGLSFSRPMGNTDLLVREALMAAEEAGAEVKLLYPYDYDVKPCNSCMACFNPKVGLSDSGLPICARNRNDDFLALAEQVIEADGLVIGAHVFNETPPGFYRVLADRFGPFYDTEKVKMYQEMLGEENYKLHEEYFKPRVCGFIALGGALRFKYVNMALPNMRILAHPLRITPVDQMLAYKSTSPGHILKQPEQMERAHQLGKNVFSQLGKTSEETEWFGEEGLCPVCHNNMMIMGNTKKVMCAVCGIDGEIKEVNGKITIDFPEEQILQARDTEAEMEYHMKAEVFGSLKDYEEFKDKIPERIQKYKDHKIEVVKPAK